MGWSLGQAAQETGRGKSTLHRALKDGTLSGTKDDKGRWQIDPAELFRVFPRNAPGDAPRDETEPRSGTPLERGREAAAVLEVRVEMLTAALDREQELTGELRSELREVRDELRAAQERIIGLLAAPPAQAARRGWISRFLGRPATA